MQVSKILLLTTSTTKVGAAPSFSCPGEPIQHPTKVLGNFFNPDGETPVNPDGTLIGDVIINEGGGFTIRYEWDFQPVAQ